MESDELGSLDYIPTEIMLTIVFPFCDTRSLYNLSKVNSKWKLIVKNYMGDFNKIVKMTVTNDCEALFKFVTTKAAKLEKLKLKWRTSPESCSDVLVGAIEDNTNLKEIVIQTSSPQSRLSNNVLDAISSIEHRLSHVSVRLYINGNIRNVTRKDLTELEYFNKVKYFNGGTCNDGRMYRS